MVGWLVVCSRQTGWLSDSNPAGPSSSIAEANLPISPLGTNWAEGQAGGAGALSVSGPPSGGAGALSGPPSGPMRVKLRNKGPSDLSRLFLTENRNEGKQEQISSAVMLLWKWRQRITQIHIIRGG